LALSLPELGAEAEAALSVYWVRLAITPQWVVLAEDLLTGRFYQICTLEMLAPSPLASALAAQAELHKPSLRPFLAPLLNQQVVLLVRLVQPQHLVATSAFPEAEVAAVELSIQPIMSAALRAEL
jgi:hypothetical protein